MRLLMIAYTIVWMKLFDYGLSVYVMLSRARKLDDLHLVDLLERDTFETYLHGHSPVRQMHAPGSTLVVAVETGDSSAPVQLLLLVIITYLLLVIITSITNPGNSNNATVGVPGSQRL